MRKNAAIYTAKAGGTCGLFLRELEEGRGELIITFKDGTTRAASLQFETYIQVHLERRALPGSIERRRVIRCNCGFVVTDQLVQMRLDRGFGWADCPVCGSRIAMEEEVEMVSASIPSMDRAADTQREQDASRAALAGKIALGDFDVFLCHNNEDKPAVKRIGELLKERGILPWLDDWELRPGLPWQHVLERNIGQINSAAVFVGKNGIGPWQRQEIDALLREFVERDCPIIPVLLQDAPQTPTLPVFLRGLTWVNFRDLKSNPMARLVWGITGRRDDIIS
jgi:hypothetical protein